MYCAIYNRQADPAEYKDLMRIDKVVGTQVKAALKIKICTWKIPRTVYFHSCERLLNMRGTVERELRRMAVIEIMRLIVKFV